MLDHASNSLVSFRAQYIASAVAMTEWLDRQIVFGNIGVHAALRALSQIVEDVEDHHVTISRATSEAIGIGHRMDEDQAFWYREVSDLARVAVGAYDEGEGQVDVRKVVARGMLGVVDEVGRLKQMLRELVAKWTAGPGGGYTPHGIRSNMAGAGGHLSGAFEAVLGKSPEGAMTEEAEADGEMWDALKELTTTEENLLVKWRRVAVENDRELSERQNYVPPGAADKHPFLKDVPLKTSNVPLYTPHPAEVKAHTDKKAANVLRERNRTEAAETLEKERAKVAMELTDLVGSEVEELTTELVKLKKLQKFRLNKRQDLFDNGQKSGKYAALKITEVDDDSEEEENGDPEEIDIFAKADDKAKKNRGRIKMAAMRDEDDMMGKFPFKLNRYTIDDRMRPVRLWKGGAAACDIPPLVDGEDDAKEVSTVALIVPTQFVGGPKGGRGGHKLLKRSSRYMTVNTDDSPCLYRADMDAHRGGGSGSKDRITAGQTEDHSWHLQEPEVTSDLDIRKYKDNWGNYLGMAL